LQGADASFLLVSKNFPSNTSEKDSFSQVGMRNSKYVNDIKVAVDATCPGVISCADTLAVAGAAAVQTVSLEHPTSSNYHRHSATSA
jgi:peroxidase